MNHQNHPPDLASATTPARASAMTIDAMKIAPRFVALASSVGNESGTALPPKQPTTP